MKTKLARLLPARRLTAREQIPSQRGEIRHRRRLEHFRFDAELTAHGLGAALVLAERGGAPSLPDVQLHQCAMNGLAQRIQREDTERGGYRCFHGAGCHVHREQLLQRGQRQLPQPVALPGQPVLERGLVDTTCLAVKPS